MTTVIVKSESVDAMKVIEQARQNFGSMQRSWYDFAKSVYMIRESEFYKKAGVASTFQEYVEKEFPTVSLSTMSRFMTIVEKWGDSIETRFSRDENYVLPAYDSCYHLASKESRIPKEDFTKLKKAVLDNKMSVSRLLDNIKEYIKKHRDKVEEEVKDSFDSIEEQLTKDIQDELDADDFDPETAFVIDVKEYEDDEDEEDEDEDDEDEEASLESVLAKVQFLNDALPELRSHIRSTTITKKMIKLADELNNLYSNIDEFLNRMEEESNEQTVSKAEKRA